MDAGKAFFCRIVSTNRKHKWVKIDVKIFMVIMHKTITYFNDNVRYRCF